HPVDSIYSGFRLTTGDLNGDGRPDLLSSRLDGAGLDLTRDNSQVFCRFALDNAGNFTLPSPLTDAFSYIRDFTARDWNGDGLPDILLAAESGLRWIENLSGGNAFSAPRHIWRAPGSLGHFQFTALNDDGLPDGVGTLPDDGWMPFQLFAWLGDTLSGAGTVINFPGLELQVAGHFATGRLDRDADQDIVAATSDGELALAWNELGAGGGFAVAPVSIPLPVELPYIRELLVADLNQDGAGDLLLRTSGPTYYALHRDGNGAFEDWAAIPGMDDAISLFAGDYNQDGRLDVRGHFYYDNSIGYFMAMASFDTLSQSFSAPLLLGEARAYYQQEEAFLNGGPIPGLVTGQGFALNIGNSGYLTQPYLPAPFSESLPGSLYLLPERGDLNGDGREELITGAQSIIAYGLDFLQGSAVDGLVLWDTTANCTFDSLYPALPGARLVLNSGISEQFTTPATDGHYGFYLPDAPQHVLSAVPPSDYWDICPADTILSGDGPHTVHFAGSANTSCPLMELDLSISPIRQCFPSMVSMAYRNTGTVSAAPVTVTLLFDERMTPLQATPPWASATDTSLVFEFAAVGTGEEGQIVVEMEPDCQNLVLGEVLCYNARITPDTLCSPMQAGWDGASLRASSFCAGDSLAFRVENAGNGPMAAPETYQLNIVNDDIVLLESGSIQLGPGAADTIRAPAGMEAILFEAGQPAGHPNPEPIRLLASGCLSPLDTGLLNAFPGSNGDGFAVERCGPVIGPYDPNIKVAVPEGFGEERLIRADQPIQYTIHFQNVGTDMARTVTIRDQLSPQLSLASFRAGPASHAHEWIILPDRTLAVTFPDINLPDSTSNEPGSHGFFSYSIRPVDGVLPFTRIENEAAIYFDFNPPIITNRTEHLVEKPRVAEAVYTTLCPGGIYLGQTVEQDTVLRQLFATPEQDSIVWHHINVLTVEDTAEVIVTLDAPGEWQGIPIIRDTMITLRLESSLGCDSIVRYNITLLTGLNNPLWAQDIRLSPNPAKERVQLSGIRFPAGHGKVRIFHSTGQLMEEWGVAFGAETLSWDVGHWLSGVYWAELIVAGQQARWRFVVE
ncbi:MAG: VCBS repeat-containing protein, partial [Phaeodactylibacter sp.]|nr:VCBS repeat-containing protein [Phaeodactylibacter sp.]